MNILFTNEHFYGTHHIRAETKIQNSLHIISTIQGIQKQSKFYHFMYLKDYQRDKKYSESQSNK